MTKQHFSFKDIFMFGWAKTKQHAWFIVLTAVIIGIVTAAVKGCGFLEGVVGLMVALSVVSISLTISRDHSFTFADLVAPLLSYKRVLKFFVLTALFAIPALIALTPFIGGVYSQNSTAVVIGMLLLIPLVYLSVRVKFFPFVVLENENASIGDLIHMSLKLTKGHFGSVFTFLILASLLNLVGMLFAMIGLFITIPVTIFATAHVYNKLKDHSMQ